MEPFNQQIQAIKEQAEASGTFLKAPNGEPTKLNQHQWLLVRTQEFKKRFGDWELAARQIPITKKNSDDLVEFNNREEAEKWGKENIAQTLDDEKSGGKGVIIISKNAIGKFCSDSAIKKSVNRDIHFKTLQMIPELIHDGAIVENHPDYLKGTNGKRSPENGIGSQFVTIHVLYGAVEINDVLYRVKVTLKEDPSSGKPNGAYSYETTKIELMDGQNGQAVTSPRNSNNSISFANLLQNIKNSKGDLIINISVPLDDNGEPLADYVFPTRYKQ